jgi:hypothetical protein
VRRTVLSRRDPVILPWLRPDAQQGMWALWTADVASEPLRWQQRAAWYRRLRYVRVGVESLDAVAFDSRVQVHSPFLDAGFAAALGSLPTDRRFLTRGAAMHQLFGDLLPADVLGRATKSQFGGAFFSSHSREFAASWDGEGVDEELVDPDELRRQWAKQVVDGRTYSLLQSAALARTVASAPSDLPQAVGGLA